MCVRQTPPRSHADREESAVESDTIDADITVVIHFMGPVTSQRIVALFRNAGCIAVDVYQALEILISETELIGPMRTVLIRTCDEMQPFEPMWNTLAGENPLLRWEWLGTWWRHFGIAGKQQLLILAVLDDHNSVIGFAPWYLENTSQTIHFLGSGKVCTDYLTLLCTAEHRHVVARTIAAWLLNPCHEGSGEPGGVQVAGRIAWDHLELIGGTADDAALQLLAQECHSLGMRVHTRPGQEIYYTPLPASMDEYLAQLSRNGRRQVRLVQRQLNEDPGYSLYIADQPETISEMWPTIVDLHQRRRHSVGDTGCFDEPPFSDFLLAASCKLAEVGLLEVLVLRHHDKPLAFQHVILGRHSYFTYQSGLDPDQAALNPGNLLIKCCFRRAIERGCAEYDFMRGDEAYKLRWGAVPRPTSELRIIAPRVTAQIRHRVWLTGVAVKRWIKGKEKQVGT